MNRNYFIVTKLALLILNGCAGFESVIQYSGAKVTYYKNDDDTYRISENAKESKLMVTQSFGKIIEESYSRGKSLGFFDVPAPTEKIKKAVIEYLHSTGRQCIIEKINEISTVRWEFIYSCN